MKKILLILNCIERHRDPSRVVPALKRKLPGYEIEAFSAHTIRAFVDAVRTARQEQWALVAPCGGDGTIGLAGSVLAGSTVPMMAIPMGTVNAFVRACRLPTDPVACIDYYELGRTRQIDTGSVNNHFFLCFMSIGIDAFSVHLMEKRIKQRLGRFAYLISGVQGLFRTHDLAPFMHNGDLYYHLVISNLSVYAGYHMFPDNDPADGILSAASYDSRRVGKTLIWAYRLAYGPRPTVFQIEQDTPYKIQWKEPLKIQADGEPVRFDRLITEDRTLTIAVHPKSLTILC